MKRFVEKIFLFLIFCTTLGFFICVARVLKTITNPVHYAKKVLLESGKPIKKVLFSPDDKIKLVLLGLIEAEQEALYIAAYSLTDKDIAQALMAAHERGIWIEIVADGGQMVESYSKVSLLRNAGIEVYSYYPANYKSIKEREFYSSLMHNKFIVFEHSIIDEPIVWTGSFNFTNSAAYRNQENVIILQDAELAQAYKGHFCILKGRCKHLSHVQQKKQLLKKPLVWVKELFKGLPPFSTKESPQKGSLGKNKI